MIFSMLMERKWKLIWTKRQKKKQIPFFFLVFGISFLFRFFNQRNCFNMMLNTKQVVCLVDADMLETLNQFTGELKLMSFVLTLSHATCAYTYIHFGLCRLYVFALWRKFPNKNGKGKGKGEWRTTPCVAWVTKQYSRRLMAVISAHSKDFYDKLLIRKRRFNDV